MKYVFFGTPDVALETLKALHSNGLPPVLVVTNPDAPRGRGQTVSPSPVKEWALDQGLEVITPERLDEAAFDAIKSKEPELAIVVAYGKILPEALINSFPKGVLNVHYSLLPRWRGASPVESALLHGDPKTGVSIQKMVKQLDAGDVVAFKEMPISEEDTTATLRPRLITLGADLLIDMLPKYLNGELTLSPQDEEEVTHARKFTKEDGELDLADDAVLNWNKYRAFVLSPGTYFLEDGKRIKIKKARFEDGRFLIDRVVREGGKEVDYRP